MSSISSPESLLEWLKGELEDRRRKIDRFAAERDLIDELSRRPRSLLSTGGGGVSNVNRNANYSEQYGFYALTRADDVEASFTGPKRLINGRGAVVDFVILPDITRTYGYLVGGFVVCLFATWLPFVTDIPTGGTQVSVDDVVTGEGHVG